MTFLSRFPFFAIKNKTLVDSSNNVGCFHCMKMIDKTTITQFTDNGQTVICPLCSIDSVIGDACGLEINEQNLIQANNFWYKKN